MRPLTLLAVSLLLFPQTNSATLNLFKEYLTRGMYTCTANYVKTLTDIHSLMKVAAEEYNACASQMRAMPKSFRPTQYDSLNEILEEWKMSEPPKSPPIMPSPSSSPSMGGAGSSEPTVPTM